MDGLSLDSIMGMIREFMPTISYYLNLASKLFDIFTSYLGFGVFNPGTEVPEGGNGTEEEIV